MAVSGGACAHDGLVPDPLLKAMPFFERVQLAGVVRKYGSAGSLADASRLVYGLEDDDPAEGTRLRRHLKKYELTFETVKAWLAG